MFDDLIQFYYDYFTDENNDGYRLIGSSVCVKVLNELYSKFTSRQEIQQIENLPQETKEKYWNIGCKYFEDMGDRVKASKAVYVLELITAN